MSAGPVPPPARIAKAIAQRSVEIRNAFYETLGMSIIQTAKTKAPNWGEVRVLAEFYARGVPALRAALREVFRGSGVIPSISAIYCHKSGGYGPVVKFGNRRQPGCELADLLMLVSYEGSGRRTAFGNASFLQAKVRHGISDRGASSKRQKALYASATDFDFVRPNLYEQAGFPDNNPPGRRLMPVGQHTGFCFWHFEPRPPDGSAWPWAWHASTVCQAEDLTIPTRKFDWADAMTRLVGGSFGLAVSRLKRSDFGWNRIVHDVYRRSMSEGLGATYGVAIAPDERRVMRAPGMLSFSLDLDHRIANSLPRFFRGMLNEREQARLRNVTTLETFFGGKEDDSFPDGDNGGNDGGDNDNRLPDGDDPGSPASILHFHFGPE